MSANTNLHCDKQYLHELDERKSASPTNCHTNHSSEDLQINRQLSISPTTTRNRTQSEGSLASAASPHGGDRSTPSSSSHQHQSTDLTATILSKHSDNDNSVNDIELDDDNIAKLNLHKQLSSDKTNNTNHTIDKVRNNSNKNNSDINSGDLISRNSAIEQAHDIILKIFSDQCDIQQQQQQDNSAALATSIGTIATDDALNIRRQLPKYDIAFQDMTSATVTGTTNTTNNSSNLNNNSNNNNSNTKLDNILKRLTGN